MDEERRLKPCPFCGGRAVGHNEYGKYGLFAFVRCETCGANTKCVKVEYLKDFDEYMKQPAIQRLIYLWNRRDGDDTMEEGT